MTDNLNECIDWIEEAIAKKHIKYYEYQHLVIFIKLVKEHSE